MLVISRRIGEEVVVGPDVRIRVVSLHGNQVRLAIEAPESVRVDREEVRARRLSPPPELLAPPRPPTHPS
jgi:carbon storage regulator